MSRFPADGSYVSSFGGLESNGSQKAHQNQLLQTWDWDSSPSLIGCAAGTVYPYSFPSMAVDGGGGYPFLSVAAEDYTAAMIKSEDDRCAGHIGLNLGRRTYFPSGEAAAIEQLFRRTRGIYQATQQAARCQAEGCKADLSIAKHYHRRHKVCELHSKATIVVAGGMQQRFCQQCSRFHLLSEFDEAKRSCRKRLAEHNRRRRKSQSSPTVSAPTNYSSRNPAAEENKGTSLLWNGPSLSLGTAPEKGNSFGFASPYQTQIPSWVFVSEENNNANGAKVFCNAQVEGSAHEAETVTEANLLQLGQGLLEVDFL